MNAIIQTGFGVPSRVLHPATLPMPTPRAGEVRVRVVAASLNTPDWLATLGRPWLIRPMFGWFSPRTAVRGSDFAGYVDAAGEGVHDLAVGDAVFGSCGVDPFVSGYAGTFRAHTVAPAELVARIPPGLSFDAAAAAVMSGVVALQALRDVAQVRPGEQVLINGASGGIGTFAVSLARSMGAEVTAVCSASNAALVRELGAAHVLDYATEDYTTSDRRYDVILDNVANHRPGASMRALTPGGRLLMNSVGPNAWWGPLPWLLELAFTRSSRMLTITHAPTRENLEAIGAAIVDGRTRCVIDEVFPLERAAEAVARMASRRARGNVNLRVSDPEA